MLPDLGIFRRYSEILNSFEQPIQLLFLPTLAGNGYEMCSICYRSICSNQISISMLMPGESTSSLVPRYERGMIFPDTVQNCRSCKNIEWKGKILRLLFFPRDLIEKKNIMVHITIFPKNIAILSQILCYRSKLVIFFSILAESWMLYFVGGFLTS